MAGKKWSESELAQLRGYIENTPPNKRDPGVIAGRIGRSRNSVVIIASRILKLRFCLFSEGELEQIRKYYTETDPRKFNLSYIAAKLGRERTTVSTIARKLGLSDIRRPKRTVLTGEQRYNWKGDKVKHLDSGRARARRRYKSIGDCENCGLVKATERHHKDANPLNNERSNIQKLCRRCHMTIDGRIERVRIMCKNFPKKPRSEGPCCVCTEQRWPLRKGRCHRCNEFLRRNGFEWSPELGRPRKVAHA